MLGDAYAAGVRTAMQKLAGPMGADMKPMPSGPEQTHGTDRIQYAPTTGVNDGTKTDRASATRGGLPGWLWDNFTTYDAIAPGYADGSYGQETIG